ncbi:hypothetical protein I204_05144 [Kwoniella mangroviensis CBS 8886]|uniref:uncharacterized protein n=1 Tax=Kwoniella mangroviensis CBS 8507 TaxID=1296122 RepID=UPI00080D469B|nr:uncharacterized protein I203_00806 [Kwoniella mangroviensis CBS 8507]OCF70671.1 hypothetical protein I203_00806 [Kwoniella mangroviensis CBS 8507]OCF74762.1 hypothetical protein I204_05144 [Kwoniella mangroviensis CBS 8886]
MSFATIIQDRRKAPPTDREVIDLWLLPLEQEGDLDAEEEVVQQGFSATVRLLFKPTGTRYDLLSFRGKIFDIKNLRVYDQDVNGDRSYANSNYHHVIRNWMQALKGEGSTLSGAAGLRRPDGAMVAHTVFDGSHSSAVRQALPIDQTAVSNSSTTSLLRKLHLKPNETLYATTSLVCEVKPHGQPSIIGLAQMLSYLVASYEVSGTWLGLYVRGRNFLRAILIDKSSVLIEVANGDIAGQQYDVDQLFALPEIKLLPSTIGDLHKVDRAGINDLWQVLSLSLDILVTQSLHSRLIPIKRPDRSGFTEFLHVCLDDITKPEVITKLAALARGFHKTPKSETNKGESGGGDGGSGGQGARGSGGRGARSPGGRGARRSGGRGTRGSGGRGARGSAGGAVPSEGLANEELRSENRSTDSEIDDESVGSGLGDGISKAVEMPGEYEDSVNAVSPSNANSPIAESSSSTLFAHAQIRSDFTSKVQSLMLDGLSTHATLSDYQATTVHIERLDNGFFEDDLPDQEPEIDMAADEDDEDNAAQGEGWAKFLLARAYLRKTGVRFFTVTSQVMTSLISEAQDSIHTSPHQPV